MRSAVNTQWMLKNIMDAKIDWIVDGSGVLMAVTQSGGLPLMLSDVCAVAIKEIQWFTGLTPKHVMINRVPSGIIVPVHTDTMREGVHRWHLPLKTSFHAFFWDEEHGVRFLEPGRWHPVNYSIRHTIGNYGKEERVHLIVDLVSQ